MSLESYTELCISVVSGKEEDMCEQDTGQELAEGVELMTDLQFMEYKKVRDELEELRRKSTELEKENAELRAKYDALEKENALLRKQG